MARASRRVPAVVSLMVPRPHGAMARTRLFERLDAARSAKLWWIAGEDGSGKSTLIASYIARRGLPCLWLELTAQDADPGYLFSHFAAAYRGRGGRLPVFRPEHVVNVLGFARRFFASVLDALPAGARIVLDNAEQVAQDATFAMILREALDVTPAHVQWCVLSQEVALTDCDLDRSVVLSL